MQIYEHKHVFVPLKKKTKDILYPVLCHSEIWRYNPVELIRTAELYRHLYYKFPE